MASNDAVVPVRQGPNVWLLLRTDRDGASKEEIPQMAAAAMRYWLTSALERGAKNELVATGLDEWRFGRVRPLKVIEVSQARPNMPTTGSKVADRNQSLGTIPTLAGTKPWYVLVQFWWRGSDTQLRTYPGFREGLFGRTNTVLQADWLLDTAMHTGVTTDPGDDTWADAQGDRAAEAAAGASEHLEKALKPMSFGLGAGALLALLLWQASKKN